MPFTFGDEQLANVAIISFFLKRSGGFFIKSNYKDNKLFETVVAAYIFALLDQNSLLSLFIEKKRSRSGKI